MQLLNILGYCPNNIPLIFDQAYENWGIKEFEIYKNIIVDEALKLPINPNFYQYQVFEPGVWENPKFGEFVFGLTGPKAKFNVFNHFLSQHGVESSHYINLIHPSSTAATSVQLSSGIILQQSVIVSSQTQIDFGVHIKRGASIGHHNLIEEFVEINPGVITSGNVSIGRGTKIGVGAVIKDRVKIGANTFIGMGSMVNKDIPEGVIAYGNPCKVIRENELWRI